MHGFAMLRNPTRYAYVGSYAKVGCASESLVFSRKHLKIPTMLKHMRFERSCFFFFLGISCQNTGVLWPVRIHAHFPDVFLNKHNLMETRPCGFMDFMGFVYLQSLSRLQLRRH